MKFNQFLSSVRSLAIEDDGAQIIEYALIIAVVSIVVAISLRDLTGSNFSGFINRVDVCLMTTNCL
jgi:pilus assembly protein Flp/PilA